MRPAGAAARPGGMVAAEALARDWLPGGSFGLHLLGVRQVVAKLVDLLSRQRLAQAWPHLGLLERHVVALSRAELTQQLLEPVVPGFKPAELLQHLLGAPLLAQGLV